MLPYEGGLLVRVFASLASPPCTIIYRSANEVSVK